MKKNGFAPLLIILIITILGVVGYFGYKAYSKQKLTIVNYGGHYEYCLFKDACNYLDISSASGDTFVSGMAYWVSAQTINTGKIDSKLAVNQDKAIYNDGTCKFDLNFVNNQVVVTEKPDSVCGGLNVSFDGTYLKK